MALCVLMFTLIASVASQNNGIQEGRDDMAQLVYVYYLHF